MKKPRRNDFLLIAVLLAAAVGVWAWLYFTRAQSAEVKVTVDGVVYGRSRRCQRVLRFR